MLFCVRTLTWCVCQFRHRPVEMACGAPWVNNSMFKGNCTHALLGGVFCYSRQEAPAVKIAGKCWFEMEQPLRHGIIGD